MRKMLRLIRRTFLILLFFLLAGLGLFVGRGYQEYREAVDFESLELKMNEIRQKESFTPYEKLPEMYLDAVIAVEDKRFFKHPGVDLLSTARALYHDLLAGELIEGGSTITQQLAKNMYYTQEKKFTRKVAEIFTAFALEQEFSKEEILEAYVNSIYFGDGYYSVGQASYGYFGIEPEEMDAAQCTLLAGIPNAPSAYSPTVNPALAKQRQKQVLNQMVACDYLSQAEADYILTGETWLVQGSQETSPEEFPAYLAA